MAKHLLFFVISIAHSVKNLLLEAVLGWYLGDRKLCPPLKRDRFLMKSATDLAQMIRKKEITSTELVQATIDRINEVSAQYFMINRVVRQ